MALQLMLKYFVLVSAEMAHDLAVACRWPRARKAINLQISKIVDANDSHAGAQTSVHGSSTCHMLINTVVVCLLLFACVESDIQ